MLPEDAARLWGQEPAVDERQVPLTLLARDSHLELVTALGALQNASASVAVVPICHGTPAQLNSLMHLAQQLPEPKCPGRCGLITQRLHVDP